MQLYLDYDLFIKGEVKTSELRLGVEIFQPNYKVFDYPEFDQNILTSSYY